MTRPFTVDLGWNALLSDLGIRAANVLRRADLPEDLFARPRPTLEAPEFLRLWSAMADAMGSLTPGLVIGQAMGAKAFGPQLMAAFCSADLTSAVKRLSDYKPLIGPVRLEVHDTLGGLEVAVGAEGTSLPTEFIAAELVFLVAMARRALQDDIRPVAVELRDPPQHPDYKIYFGRTLRPGPFDRLVFTKDVAERPFLSATSDMFAAFEPDLRTRLDELDRTATMAERVRSILMEALPGGQANAAYVAKRLGVSTRSLQRRLASDGTSFKAELQDLRTRLSRQYLGDTNQSSAEIAFLLGYDDPNSFIRALHDWTGTTPEAMRRDLNSGG